MSSGTYSLNDDLERVLYSREAIAERVTGLGQKIEQEYRGRNPLVLGVLKGCFPFLADLVRSMDVLMEVEFITLSSYGDETQSSGTVRTVTGLSREVQNRDVIVVEDIVDTGRTLSHLVKMLKDQRAASVRIATLLDKAANRVADVEVAYSCFDCPDAFVVGYGLDYAGRYRNLPLIGVLKPEIYG